MPKINIQKILYAARHRFLTLNNVVIAVAFIIAATWVWGSLGVMQRNYSLQKEVDYKRRQLELVALQKDNLELQKRYYKTAEFQELAARESLGLVRAGEKALVLPIIPVASDNPTTADEVRTTPSPGTTTSNFEQWVNFLFGGNSKSISKD